MIRNNAIAAVIAMILLCGTLQAAQITFAWDASDTPSPADNPIKYRLYVCVDSAFTKCSVSEAGTALTLPVQMAAGTYWVYATCYWNTISTEPAAGVQESAKSNVVNFILNIPPGNPKNFKIRIP